MIPREFDKGAKLLYNTGVKLGLSCVCTAKGLLMYHHFKPTAVNLNIGHVGVCAAILDLCVFQETGRDEYKRVVTAFCESMSDESSTNWCIVPNENELLEMKEDFTKLQLFILQTLKFDIDFEVAYTTAGRYLMTLHDRPEFQDIRHTFVKSTWKHISQFYLSERCLRYSAQEIAVACIKLNSKVFFVDLPNWQEKFGIEIDKQREVLIFDDLLFVLDVMQ